MSVQDQIIAIIAAQALLEPQQITLESKPEDLGIDSLGLVEAIFAIEETFNISVPYNANDPAESGFDLSTVGAIVAAVKVLLQTKAV